MVPTTVEPLTDMGQVLGGDPRTPVSDGNLDASRCGQPRTDLDGGSLRGIAGHVVQQVLEHVRKRDTIRTDPQSLGHLDTDGVRCGERAKPVEHPVHEPA